MPRSTNARPTRRPVRRTAIGVAFVLSLVAALLAQTGPVQASHEPLRHFKGTFPYHGFLWLDDVKGTHGSGDAIWIYSDRCKPSEANAWARVRAQLAGGSSEFRGAWPGGIDFVGAACTSAADIYTDVMLDYMTTAQWSSYSDHGNFGGHVHTLRADSAWCEAMGAHYPCGYHISRVHINEPHFDSYSSSYQIGFLLHETSHSMGTYDYCGHTSVANNGLYCALAGNWYSVDRQMLRDLVYKNSPVYFR